MIWFIAASFERPKLVVKLQEEHRRHKERAKGILAYRGK